MAPRAHSNRQRQRAGSLNTTPLLSRIGQVGRSAAASFISSTEALYDPPPLGPGRSSRRDRPPRKQRRPTSAAASDSGSLDSSSGSDTEISYPSSTPKRRPDRAQYAPLRRQPLVKHWRKSTVGCAWCCLATFALLLVGVTMWLLIKTPRVMLVEAECSSCLSAMIPLQGLALLGDDAFTDFFIEICILFKIDDPDVCAGAVGTVAAFIAHSLRTISVGSSTMQLYCTSLFGLCPYQAPKPYPVPLPAATNGTSKRWTSTGRTPFTVVHISDVHLDQGYQVGTDSLCTKPICCHDWTGPGAAPLAVVSPAQPFGTTGCDAPESLVDSMLAAIDDLVPESEFTLFTGDVVNAAVWIANESIALSGIHAWDVAAANRTVYSTLGNHDSVAINEWPRSSSQNINAVQPIFDLVSTDWAPSIGANASASVKSLFGCYAVVHPGTELKVISLNTNYWETDNFWLYDSNTFDWDPNGILAWLIAELDAAERAGQRVWIIGHSAPGRQDSARDQSRYLNQIFQRYSTTITAQFYGHSHMDQFEIGYSDYHGTSYLNRTEAEANQIAFVGPALTPRGGNPAFKTYSVDPDTYEVMDYTVYYTDSTSAAFNSSPVWGEYYSARQMYNNEAVGWPAEAPLNASFWHRVTEQMLVNDTVINQYTAALDSGLYGSSECDDEACRSSTVCDLRSMESSANCDTLTVGLKFQKRSVESPSTAPAAQGIAGGRWLSKRGEHPSQTPGKGALGSCEGPSINGMLKAIAKYGKMDEMATRADERVARLSRLPSAPTASSSGTRSSTAPPASATALTSELSSHSHSKLVPRD